jgi:hypothetical protein
MDVEPCPAGPAGDPVLLLTDEPFGSVDVQTGEDLVLRVRQERGIAILLVTRDIDKRLHRRPRNRPHPRPRPPRPVRPGHGNSRSFIPNGSSARPSTTTCICHASLIDHHFDNLLSPAFHVREMSYPRDRVGLRT